MVDASGSDLWSEGPTGTKVSADLLSNGDPIAENEDMRVWDRDSASFSDVFREQSDPRDDSPVEVVHDEKWLIPGQGPSRDVGVDSMVEMEKLLWRASISLSSCLAGESQYILGG